MRTASSLSLAVGADAGAAREPSRAHAFRCCGSRRDGDAAAPDTPVRYNAHTGRPVDAPEGSGGGRRGGRLAKQRKAKHRRFGRALSGMGSDAELETDEQALALSDMMLDAEGSFARHGKMSLSALVESFSDPDVNNYDYLKRGLIHPHSGFRRLWDFATMYFVMYTAVVLPYFIAFDCEPEHPSFLWVKNELMDCMCAPPRLRRSRETS